MVPDATREPVCWVVSDGKAGMEIQCLGLAEALGLRPLVKRIRTRAPWRWLPPLLWRDPLRALSPQGDSLTPPWPDLVIGSGRQSVAPVLAIRRASRRLRPERPAYAIQIQNPTVDPARFDLVVTPRHDGLKGPNVLESLGSIHRVTAERLAAEAARWAPAAAGLPEPRITVLLGGNSKVFRFTAAEGKALGESLAAAARTAGGSLLVTPSRRTSPEALAAVRAALDGLPHLAWDGSGDNPYFGFLGLAQAVVATCDSVNMTTEAAATGRPVLVAPLPGGSAKFRRFHAEMQAAGLTRPFAGRLEAWQPPLFDEPRRLAAEIRRRLPLFTS